MKEYEYCDNNGDFIDYYTVVNDATMMLRELNKKDKQITKLTNNWNELEEWIMQDVKDEKPDLYFQVLRKIDILDKMKEIKEENK